jgi:TetR/AcrR family transcriptional regulator, cholesterol catabolism regulator
MSDVINGEARTNRQKILEVFTEMVADHGYAGAPIADVAATVGVSKGTILHHFGNKHELLNEMGIAYIERRHTQLRHALEHLDDPVQRFAAVVFCTVLGMRDDRSASRAFGREFSLFQRDPKLEPARERRKAYAARAMDVVSECMEAGVLADEDPSFVLLEVLGLCNWAWTWYRPDGRLSAEEIATRFVRALLCGLGPELGTGEELRIDAERISQLLRESLLVGAAT